MHICNNIMKKTIIFISLLFVTTISFGQTAALKNYDFNKDHYYLIGIRTDMAYGPVLADTLDVFYTNDIKTLNEFKKTWVFTKPSPMYACGYDYMVHICKNGESLEHFAINFDCNVISIDKGYFYFDLKKLTMFKSKVHKAFISTNNFPSVIKGREFRNKILTDSNLIISTKPQWIEYEGSFNFTYAIKSGEVKDPFNIEEKYFKQLTEEIKKNYPGEGFELTSTGGSNTELYMELKCNKSLSDKFNLYPKSWNKWTAYDIELISYWKTKQKAN